MCAAGERAPPTLSSLACVHVEPTPLLRLRERPKRAVCEHRLLSGCCCTDAGSPTSRMGFESYAPVKQCLKEPEQP